MHIWVWNSPVLFNGLFVLLILSLEKIQSLFISFQQSKEGQEMLPEQIKAVLLDSAGLHGVV